MKRLALALPWPALKLLAALSLLGLVLCYHLSLAIDGRPRQRVEIIAGELVAADLAADLEILKLQQRRRLDYDSLVAANQRTDDLLARLEAEFARLDLQEELAPARAAWREKQANIEDFKRINAMISTSETHFINLSEELGRQLDNRRLNQISRRLLSFLMGDGNGSLPMLVSSLYQVEGDIGNWPPANRDAGGLLVTHGTLILSHFREIQQISKQLLQSPFADSIGAAQRTYNQACDRLAWRYRLATLGFALLLAAGTGLALVKMRHQGSEAPV